MKESRSLSRHPLAVMGRGEARSLVESMEGCYQILLA